MLNKKYMGTFAFAVAFVSLMMLAGNFAYAQKEPKGQIFLKSKPIIRQYVPLVKVRLQPVLKGK